MTVKELIELLQRMPQEASVIAENDCGEGKAEVESIGIDEGRVIVHYSVEGLGYLDR